MKKPVPFGKYYLLERINVGGMAEVFRAKAYGVEGFERLVAVKRILPNIAEDKDFITMFIDEAKIAVQLNHANIAQIFDLGVVDSSYYIALEHVHGRDLRAIFDRCRGYGDPMPVAQACFVLMKVCEGLDYAHNKRSQGGEELGLVHRDVSPQNVLVSFEGEVKLVDFGIAKAAGKGTKTQAGILKGKFGYMSPEQVRGLPINRRSDIFSCGIVLYELLTGERLFVGESDFSTLEKVRNVEILPPTTYNRRIPEELERIVLKALARDPDDRYQNAIDLHDELQAFVYTAGEFYSRKDLAGWMKRTFSREIEDETAKLEQFRQLPRPPELAGGGAHLPLSAGAPRSNGRPLTLPPDPPVRMDPVASASAELEWDDDELETHIYEGGDTSNPLGGVNAPAMGGVGVAAGGASPGDTDLSSLVPQSSSAWPSGPDRSTSGSYDVVGAPPDVVAPADVVSPPDSVANGSNRGPTPLGGAVDDPPPVVEDPSAIIRLAAGRAQPAFEGAPAESAFGGTVDPSLAPAEGVSAKHIALGIAGVVAAIIAAMLLLAKGEQQLPTGIAALPDEGAQLVVEDEPVARSAEPSLEPSPEPSPGTPPEEVAAAGDNDRAESGEAGAAAAQPAVAAQYLQTGFDVIVDPKGAIIRLDGSDVGPAPRKIRNVMPGRRQLTIEARGFKTLTEEVEAVEGDAPVLRLRLEAIDIIGRFTSEPPGARVILFADGKRRRLGEAPVSGSLDPRRTYEVKFEKSGYVAVRKPVDVSGDPEVVVAAVMERAAPRQRTVRARPEREVRDSTRPPDQPDPVPPRSTEPTPTPDRPKVIKQPTGAPGTLLIGSKPPCKILIDGRDTGLKTPQREIKLSPGIHKITLVNDEHGLNKNLRVTIRSGKATRVIENLLDSD